MPIRVVAISRTSGAGGESVGRIVSDQLGFRYVDEEIIAVAAAKQGVHPDLVADAERRKGLLARLIDQLARTGVDAGSVGTVIPDATELGRSPDFRTLIAETIQETSQPGDVVIVAHAASIALGGRDDLLRVLITAPPKSRARRLAEAGAMTESEAATLIKRSDEARADYLKRFYSVDRELPTHYDLVVNTDVLGLDAAAGIVVRAARGS